MIEDKKFILTVADQYSDWAPVPINLYHHWRLLAAVGIVTLQFMDDGPERDREKGNWGITQAQEPIQHVRVKSSTVPQTVTVTVGNELEFDSPASGGGGGVATVLPQIGQGGFDSQHAQALAAGSIGGYGGWDGAKARRVWITVSPSSVGGVWVQDPTNPQAQEQGMYVPAGESRAVEANFVNTSGQGEVGLYNPNVVPIWVALLVEFNS